MEAHITSLDQLISSTNQCSILLWGDYNISNITWSNGNLGLTSHGNLSSASTYIIYVFSFLNFFQLNEQPNCHGSLLDLIFLNSNKVSVNIATFFLISPDSYHPPLLIVFPFLSNTQPQNEHFYFYFKSGDYILHSDISISRLI